MLAFFGLFPLIYVAMGVAIFAGAFDDGNAQPEPPRVIGLMFAAIGGGITLVAWAFAAAVVVAGRKLARRTGYTFCLVMAGIECLYSPFGTVLGVFTILVLVRPSVKELFDLHADGRFDENYQR